MTSLISPGVDVKVLHEDFYVSGVAATVPLIFIATQDEKFQPDGTTPALGTFEHGVLRTVTSIRQAIELYGVPKFYTSLDGQPHHGDARNEYGLDALNKVLEVNRRAYVVRANVNLNDNLEDIKALWERKASSAADYLNVLVAEWISQYNNLNGLVPADAGYKTTVDKATMKSLVQEAMAEVFNSYSFSKDAFEVAFLSDHSTAQAGYQDIVFSNNTGYVVGADQTGLDSTALYGAQVRIVSSGGTSTHDLFYTGAQVPTFAALVSAINTTIGATGTASLVQGRIRIKSTLTGATSSVEVIADGTTGRQPLFASVNLFSRIASKIVGTGVALLDVYDAGYTDVIGGFDGVDGLVSDWADGATVGAEEEFTALEAEGLLLAAASDFESTKEFKNLTALGINDSTRRAEIVKALQAAVNDPYSSVRSEALEYNIATVPGYPELADELTRLGQDMFEEVFIIGETPMDKPPVGPNSISNWALTPNRVTSESIGYWYGHGITSNIDGANILSTAACAALRTCAYSDSVSEGEWIAPAGVTRGGCPQLNDVGFVTGTLGGPTTFVSDWLDNGTRDDLYEFPKSINPITFIPGRGFVVMGQKTASPVQQSTDRVAVSRLVKYIKRQLRKGLFAYLFEPNDDITRRNVKAATDNFLSTLIDRRALYDFASICDTENNDPQSIDNNILYIDIAIKPVKAVEFIYARVKIVRTGANIGTGKNER
jgi:hypothetical protein